MGTDQAVSVRIPTLYNGIYGLKPAFCLVPCTGATLMTPMIDHLGRLGASLEDIAVLLEAMAGYNGLDPRMTQETPLPSQTKPYMEMLRALQQEFAASPAPG